METVRIVYAPLRRLLLSTLPVTVKLWRHAELHWH